jgi:hypothetical protein
LLGAAGNFRKIKRSSFWKNSLLGAEEAPQKVTKISHEKHVLGKNKTKNRNLLKILKK